MLRNLSGSLKRLKLGARERLEHFRFRSPHPNEAKLRSEKPISVAIIAQDCLEHLRDLISSVESFAGEVIVVDGGSTDGSQAYCKEHPLVKLIERKWDGNFANQKNCAIEACEREWILHLDSDERVGENFLRYWPHLCANSSVIGYRLPMYWLSPDDPKQYVDSAKHYPSYCPRFFRSDANFRYHQQNPVHVTFDKSRIQAMQKLYGIHLFHYCFQWLSKSDLERKAERYRRDHPGSEHVTDQYYLYWNYPYKTKRTTEAVVRGEVQSD